MKTVEFSYGGHKWDKQNLTTICKGKVSYDIYKCSVCGITSKSYRFGLITVCEKDISKLAKCKCRNCISKRRIKITDCRAYGGQFKNITPGSVHEIVTPPDGKGNKRGEWVMGVSEPVLILAGEYDYCE